VLAGRRSAAASLPPPVRWWCRVHRPQRPGQESVLDPLRGEPAHAVRWKPPAGKIAWQWELDHPLNLRSAADMGAGSKTYRGRPAGRPTVYDIDGFDNPASTVRALRRLHAHVICHIEVGAAESYRSDYTRFPKPTLGRRVPGYPGERYLNINNPVVAEIIKARISMCARKGFDAVELDIDDSYADRTRFPDH
jgi:hypothetical protein